MNLRTSFVYSPRWRFRWRSFRPRYLHKPPPIRRPEERLRPRPNKDAPAAPGAQSVSNAEGEANSIASRIEQARKQGKDVSKAETEEKQGEAALQAGYKAEAAQHFERAKDDLGTM